MNPRNPSDERVATCTPRPHPPFQLTYMYMYMYTYTQIYTYMFIHPCVDAYKRVSIYRCEHVHIYTHTCINTCRHMYIYIYTRTEVLRLPGSTPRRKHPRGDPPLSLLHGDEIFVFTGATDRHRIARSQLAVSVNGGSISWPSL